MIVDTDILIWYLRGQQEAIRFLDAHIGFSISAITYMELVQGMRNKQELAALKRTILYWQAKMIHINETISAKAILLVEKYYLSHSMKQADAQIAASALQYQLSLATGNQKHYSFIKDLDIITFPS